MTNYESNFKFITKTLNGFVEARQIDVSKLNVFDGVIEKSRSDQFKILNNSYLSLNDQRTIFGAFRNISDISETMKIRLKEAHKTGDNPTTAELALEIMPSFITLSQYLDDILAKKEVYNTEKIFLFSRNLYKKSKQLGFFKNAAAQLKEIKLSRGDIEQFFKKFNDTVTTELELQEEVGSPDDNSN
jgi:trehalose-6-phosphatase